MGNWNQSSVNDYESEAYGVGLGGATLGGSAGDFDYSVPTSVGGGRDDTQITSTPSVSQEDVQSWVSSNPNATPDEIAKVALETGVTASQIAQAYDVPETDVTTALSSYQQTGTTGIPAPAPEPEYEQVRRYDPVTGNTYNFNIDTTQPSRVQDINGVSTLVYSPTGMFQGETLSGGGQTFAVNPPTLITGTVEDSVLQTTGMLDFIRDPEDIKDTITLRQLELAKGTTQADPADAPIDNISAAFQNLGSGTGSVSTYTGDVITEEMAANNPMLMTQRNDIVTTQLLQDDVQPYEAADGRVYADITTEPSLFSAGTYVGTLLANSVIGKLGGVAGAMGGFGISQGPIGANLGYTIGQTVAQGGVIPNTFQGTPMQNPLTGEYAVEHTFNNPFTETSLSWVQTEEQIKKQQDLFREWQTNKGDEETPTEKVAEDFVNASVGTRNPTYSDYINNGNFFESLVSTAITDAPFLDSLTKGTAQATIDILNGADPVKAILSNTGTDLDEIFGISKIGKDALTSVVGQDIVDAIDNNLVVFRVGTDVMISGLDPIESLRNRFGDTIVENLGATTPNQKALGTAGLNAVVNLDQGMAESEVAGNAVVDYFKSGGDLSMLNTGNWGSVPSGLGININMPSIPDDISEVLDKAWQYAKDSFAPASEKLAEFDDWRRGIADELGQALSMDIDLDIGLSGIDFDLGLGGELPTVGLDVSGPDISIPSGGGFDIGGPDVSLPQLSMLETYPGQYMTSDGDYVESLKYNIDFLDETPSAARAMLRMKT